MTQVEKLLYTAKVRTTGGREGASRSADGRLDIRLSTPGSPGSGTNPEQLFAAGWSACFEGAMAIAARKMNIALPADMAIDAEVDLNAVNDAYFLRARLNVTLPGLDQATAQAVVNAAHQTCPYSKATRGNIDVEPPMDTSTMSEPVDHPRRRFFGVAAMTIAAAQLGMIGSANAQATKAPSRLPQTKPGTHTSFRAMKQIEAGDLNVGYAEDGPAEGTAVILLHGWPYDIYSYVDVAPLLASAGYRVIIPYLRGYGTTRFLSDETPRNGQQAAIAADIIALMDALKIEQATVAGYDWGARTANIIAALWPQRCKAMVSVSGYLIGSQELNRAPLPPKAELQWWYQFYFATERGRAGYEKYTRDFVRLIWELASPKWKFDDATFGRSAPAFDNPDHVAVSIHNYRWRLGLASGEPKYDALEKKLAALPTIGVPTITMEGDANGAPHPDPAAYAKKFTGQYEHRLISGGVGHNLPQEAPQAFAKAVLDVDRS